MGGSDPTRQHVGEFLCPSVEESISVIPRGGVFLGVLARSGVGAVDDISLQRAARNSAATSHPGSSVIDALPKLFAVRPD